MDVVFVRVRTDGSSRPLPLRAGTTIIGRDDNCDVRIPVAAISRRHCAVTVDQAVRIRDLGSSNGTFVNNKIITREVDLAPGDVVAMGPMIFVVRIDGEPATVDTSVARAATSAVAQGRKGDPIVEGDLDDSSFFDFDFADDDEQQPPL